MRVAAQGGLSSLRSSRMRNTEFGCLKIMSAAVILAAAAGCSWECCAAVPSPNAGRGASGVGIRGSVRVENVVVRPSGSSYEDFIHAVVSGNVTRIDEFLRGGLWLDDVYCISETYPSGGNLSLTNFLRGCDLEFVRDPSAPRLSYYRIYPKTCDDKLPYGYVRLYGTPLMVACRAGNPIMVRELLKRGANPNVIIATKNPGLLTGALCRRPWVYAYAETFLSMYDQESAETIAGMLKESGSRLLGLDSAGRNTVFDALEAWNPSFLKTAISSGCDVSRVDRYGLTACDWVAVQDRLLREDPGPKGRHLRKILAEERTILRQSGAPEPRLGEADIKWMIDEIKWAANEKLPHLKKTIALFECRRELESANLARSISIMKARSRQMDIEGEIEAERIRLASNQQYYSEQRELFLDKLYPSVTREDRHAAEAFGLDPVNPRSTTGYGIGGDSTLYRDRSGNLYKVDKGTVRKYDKDGDLGPVLNR